MKITPRDRPPYAVERVGDAGSTINNRSPGLDTTCRRCGAVVPATELAAHGAAHRAEGPARPCLDTVRVLATVHATRVAAAAGGDALETPCPSCIAGPGQACHVTRSDP